MAEPGRAARRDAEAADWVARRDAGDIDPTEERAFQDWLGRDDLNYGAYVRAEVALAAIGHAERAARASTRLPRRSLLTAGALAAAAPLVVLAWSRFHTAPRRVYRSNVGEIQRLQWGDGLEVTLDTQTRLVAVDDREVRVRVETGRAWFDQARDSSRPIRVDLDGGSLLAGGASFAFAVDRRPDGWGLTLAKGSVLADCRNGARHLSGPAEARFADGALVRVDTLAPADLEQMLAWREGRLLLRGQTVGEAVATINKYNHTQIQIVPPDLGARRLIGQFRLDDPRTFTAALAASFGAHVRDAGDVLIVDIEDSHTT